MPVSPFDQFVAFARGLAPGMTDEELAPVRRFRVAKAAKGEYLARVGDANAGSSFLLRGLVRQVFSGPDGRERVNDFATEDRLVCTYRAMLTAALPDLAIQALEPTWYLAMAAGAIPELMGRYPGWRELVARLTEQKFIAAELRNRTLLMDDATERYRSFREQYAAIAERVPLSQVAAYIGVTPEALSRIRRRTPVGAS
ncbi:MAG: Crp/Fnr family transcriptional regulator [Catenulispora sp.]